jgi:hypothetical protein
MNSSAVTVSDALGEGLRPRRNRRPKVSRESTVLGGVARSETGHSAAGRLFPASCLSSPSSFQLFSGDFISPEKPSNFFGQQALQSPFGLGIIHSQLLSFRFTGSHFAHAADPDWRKKVG